MNKRCAFLFLLVVNLISCNEKKIDKLIEPDIEVFIESNWQIESTIDLVGTDFPVDFAEHDDFVPGPILSYGDDRYILADKNNSECYYVDLNKNEIKKITSFGKGVDEVEGVRSIVKTGNGFAILSDGYPQRVLYFDTEGNFISNQVMKKFYGDVAFIDNNILLVNNSASDSDNTNSCIYSYSGLNDSSEKVFNILSRKYQKVIIPENEFNFGCQLLLYPFKNIFVVTHRYLNYIYIYKKDGEKVLYININDSTFEGTNFVDRPPNRTILHNNDIEIDDNGLLFLSKGYGFYDRTKFRIDVFDLEGQLKAILFIENYPSYISTNHNKLIVADDSCFNNIKIYDYGLIMK